MSASVESARAAHWRELRRHKDEILNVRRKLPSQRGRLAIAMDRVGALLGNPRFFVAFFAAHAAWLLWNSGWLPLPAFDPPPHQWLAMIASVEAPLLSILILMHQRRERRITEVREETDVQIALHAERETTRLLQMVAQIHEALGLPADVRDEELEMMKEPLDPERVISHVEQDVAASEGEEGGSGGGR